MAVPTLREFERLTEHSPLGALTANRETQLFQVSAEFATGRPVQQVGQPTDLR